MQGPLSVSDAAAEAVPHWSKVWKDPDPIHMPHGYVNAGLPKCQPDCLCPDLVRRVFHKGLREWNVQDRVHQIAAVGSMHWLQTAGSFGLENFMRDGSVSFGYDGFVQSLATICKACAAFALHMATLQQSTICTVWTVLIQSAGHQTTSPGSCAAGGLHLSICSSVRIMGKLHHSRQFWPGLILTNSSLQE